MNPGLMIPLWLESCYDVQTKQTTYMARVNKASKEAGMEALQTRPKYYLWLVKLS